MRINTLAMLLVAAVLVLAFWRPLRGLWEHAQSEWELQPFDVLFVIALVMIVLRVLLARNNDKEHRDGYR